MPIVNENVAIASELDLRHILKVLAEAKLQKGERWTKQDEIEAVMSAINSQLVNDLFGVDEDAKEKAINKLDTGLKFLFDVIRAVIMNDTVLVQAFNMAYSYYVDAEHAYVPKDYPYRLQSLLKSFQEVKEIYNRFKQQDQRILREQFDRLFWALEVNSIRGMDVVEQGMGNMIYSQQNIEEFAKKYLGNFRHQAKTKGAPLRS